MSFELKRKLDYSDLVATPDDGKRYELVEGDLFVTPSPNPVHQRVSRQLLLPLQSYFDDRSIGEVFYAPIDLILTNQDVFVPDLVVVSRPQSITKRGIEGAPLLVVEILSPSTRKRDRGLKARRYAELGVEHYWIVDPENRHIECGRLAGKTFEVVAEEEGEATLRHPNWDELEIDLGALWR